MSLSASKAICMRQGSTPLKRCELYHEHHSDGCGICWTDRTAHMALVSNCDGQYKIEALFQKKLFPKVNLNAWWNKSEILLKGQYTQKSQLCHSQRFSLQSPFILEEKYKM